MTKVGRALKSRTGYLPVSGGLSSPSYFRGQDAHVGRLEACPTILFFSPGAGGGVTMPFKSMCRSVLRSILPSDVSAAFLVALLLRFALTARAADPPGWQVIQVPGAWETNAPAMAGQHDGFAWYRAWLKPHDGFFAKHERNL